mmetsp:Transcript_898/g.1632  ORF Transcript_898/g.1632 Transcript_898/m.1632 type:complete len:108 (+) Transcript_898:1200-1523(+)
MKVGGKNKNFCKSKKVYDQNHVVLAVSTKALTKLDHDFIPSGSCKAKLSSQRLRARALGLRANQQDSCSFLNGWECNGRHCHTSFQCWGKVSASSYLVHVSRDQKLN